MAVIPSNFGEGGSGLVPGQSDVDLVTILRDAADDLANFQPSQASSMANGIVDGLAPDAPTTASTQATGSGATAWRANLSAGAAVVAGVYKTHAAQADIVIHSATQLIANGQSCKAWLIEKNVAGTVSTVSVKGAAATTGSEVAPTDAEITVAAGADWIKLALITLNRTGDTTVTTSISVAARRYQGVPVAATIKTTKGL